MKSFTRFITICVLGLSLLFAGSITRAQAQGVELVTKAEKEVEVEELGAKVKKLVPPQKMVPGDDVLYTVTYTNKTTTPAEKVLITNAVPPHTRYKEGSAAGEGADITFSVDGGKTFAAPGKLTVSIKDKDGKAVVRPATAPDYTHIRWSLRDNVAPGRTGTVTFRVVIL
jgi:uncharacterized repeat protein (TIGR01451 family)